MMWWLDYNIYYLKRMVYNGLIKLYCKMHTIKRLDLMAYDWLDVLKYDIRVEYLLTFKALIIFIKSYKALSNVNRMYKYVLLTC